MKTTEEQQIKNVKSILVKAYQKIEESGRRGFVLQMRHVGSSASFVQAKAIEEFLKEIGMNKDIPNEFPQEC